MDAAIRLRQEINMPAIAKLPDFPNRIFKSRYWDMPDGSTVYAYISDETKPMLVAVDLHDIQAVPTLGTVTDNMRAGRLPFRAPREVRVGAHGRFLVAEVGA